MLLSIIIPHYNLPRELLERCIASITQLEIAADDYEIIVVFIKQQFNNNQNRTTKRTL